MLKTKGLPVRQPFYPKRYFMMEQENKNLKNDTAHGTLLSCGGGYTIYMAYRMVENTRAGLSSMSMTTTLILAAFLALGGAFVLGFGMHLLYQDYKKKK